MFFFLIRLLKVPKLENFPTFFNVAFYYKRISNKGAEKGLYLGIVNFCRKYFKVLRFNVYKGFVFGRFVKF